MMNLDTQIQSCFLNSDRSQFSRSELADLHHLHRHCQHFGQFQKGYQLILASWWTGSCVYFEDLRILLLPHLSAICDFKEYLASGLCRYVPESSVGRRSCPSSRRRTDALADACSFGCDRRRVQDRKYACCALLLGAACNLCFSFSYLSHLWRKMSRSSHAGTQLFPLIAVEVGVVACSVLWASETRQWSLVSNRWANRSYFGNFEHF